MLLEEPGAAVWTRGNRFALSPLGWAIGALDVAHGSSNYISHRFHRLMRAQEGESRKP
jgi:hypothetical protein